MTMQVLCNCEKQCGKLHDPIIMRAYDLDEFNSTIGYAILTGNSFIYTITDSVKNTSREVKVITEGNIDDLWWNSSEESVNH